MQVLCAQDETSGVIEVIKMLSMGGAVPIPTAMNTPVPSLASCQLPYYTQAELPVVPKMVRVLWHILLALSEHSSPLISPG